MSEIYDIREILGGTSKYTNDYDAPAVKDEIVKKLIPEVVSECALYLSKPVGEPCASDNTVQKIAETMDVNGTPAEIISQAKSKLGCENERCVLGKLTPKLGEAVVRGEISLRLKVLGPTDNKLLSNVHIDSTLKQWETAFSGFFAYNFNMLNYASYAYDRGYILNHPDTLATIQWADLYLGEYNKIHYNCAACVINSDIYQNEGKHWMALFVSARGDKWTVEFFNSSGNAPAPEWVSWMVKTKAQMDLISSRKGLDIPVEMMRVSNIRHQQSKSECGLYSLFYIWARLHNIPPEYFMENPVPDQLMFEFRQHLFEDPKRKVIKKFDWDSYKNSVRLEWE